MCATSALLLAACEAPSKPSPARDSPATAATPSASSTPSCSATGILESWPLSRLAEATLAVPVDEGDVSAVRSEVAAGAGGVLLFGNSAPLDLASQLRTLRAAALGGIQPFVMTDEEGGAVQRMANLVGDIPSARTMAATMSPAAIQQLAAQLGARLAGAGVTMDLAPVLDLDAGAGPSNSDPDGTRSFSADPTTTSADGVAFLRGLRAGGVLPVVKHFPGLGQASGNTDVAPATTLPWTELQTAGLLPFSAAVNAGAPAVMVSNAIVPGLTTQPASISSVVMRGVLRGQLGFSGLIVTDTLSAGAFTHIGYDVPRAAVAALQAGADMLLFSAAASQVSAVTEATVGAVVAAVHSGELPLSTLVDAVSQILRAKNVDLCA